MMRIKMGLICLALLTVALSACADTLNFETGAPCAFIATTPLASYGGLTFSGGGAILDQCGNFGINAHSGVDFLAFATGTYATGPEFIDFPSAVSSVSIFAGDGDSGSFTLQAFDGSENSLGQDVETNPGGQYVELQVSADGIETVELSSNLGAWVADDLSFNGSENPTVPEPASMLLLGGGLAGLARILRGRKR